MTKPQPAREIRPPQPPGAAYPAPRRPAADQTRAAGATARCPAPAPAGATAASKVADTPTERPVFRQPGAGPAAAALEQQLQVPPVRVELARGGHVRHLGAVDAVQPRPVRAAPLRPGERAELLDAGWR